MDYRILVRDYLHHYGYTATARTAATDLSSDADIRSALMAAQDMLGLPQTGVIDSATAGAMSMPRCGCSDVVARADCRWPKADVPYSTDVSLALRGLSREETKQAFDTACAQWNSVCGIRLKRVETEPANIRARGGRGRADQLDGPSGVLAYSELPCQVSMRQVCRQVYDLDETWNYNMAVGVICHEIGHAIGISHIPASQGPALMNPTYNPNVIVPLALDIQVAIQKYGAVASPPPPPPLPTLPDTLTGTLVISGVAFTFSANRTK